MNPITIIISNGIKSSVIIDGKRINGIEEISFRHKAAEYATIETEINAAVLGCNDVSDALLVEAAKELGYELATE